MRGWGYDLVTRGMAGVIGVVSPEKAMRYIRRRAQLAAYSAGSRRGPNRKWNPSRKSEDAHLASEQKLIIARARDLVRNSPNLDGALGRIVNNVNFIGIKPQFEFRIPDGSLDKARNSANEDRWKRWAEHRDVRYYELQDLVIRHMWMDGRILVHFFVDPDLAEAGLPPLGIELLECDHLDEQVHGVLATGNIARRGIEYNKRGKVAAYHLFTEHPGDYLGFRTGKSRRIPAENIEHIFLRKRASQHDGFPWLTSVIMTMRDFDDYQNSERLAARLAALFGIFVESQYALDGDGHFIGGVANEDGDKEFPEYVSLDDPAQIITVPPGTKIQVAEYTRPSASYEPFTKTTLKAGSMGTQQSYEAFSNDYTDASYSSSRSASLEERRGYQKQQLFEIVRFCVPTMERFNRLQAVFGHEAWDIEAAPVSWQAPGFAWVDPLKDAKAAREELSMGITTRRKLCADRGLDFEETVEQLARETDMLRKHGLAHEEANHAGQTA